MTAAEQSKRFTEGSLLWPLLALAAPLIATQLLQVSYNFIDTFWVGRLGSDAVSALSFSWPVVFLIISIGGGITNAGTILISQNTGAGDDIRARHVASQTLAVVGLLSIVFSAVGVIVSPQLLQMIGTAPGTRIHVLAVTYTRIVFLGLPFTFGFFIFQSILRGWGDAKTPMYVMASSVILNILMDPVFIFGFENNPLFGWVGLTGVQQSLFVRTGFAGFGVEGAAVATVLSRGLAGGVGLWLLFSGRVGFSLSLFDLKPKVTTVRELVAIGAPLSIEQVTNSISVIVMTALIAHTSTDAVGAYGIGDRYQSLVWLPTVAMGMAVETVVGQNLGNAKPNRARRTVYFAVALVGVLFLAVSVVTVWFARPIVSLFITGEGSAAVIRHGTDFLRIVAPTWVFMATFHLMNGGFCGAGLTRLSMVLTILTQWGLRVAIAAVLMVGIGLNATGAWYGIALSNVVAVIVGTAVFLWWHWTGNTLEDGNTHATNTDEEHTA